MSVWQVLHQLRLTCLSSGSFALVSICLPSYFQNSWRNWETSLFPPPTSHSRTDASTVQPYSSPLRSDSQLVCPPNKLGISQNALGEVCLVTQDVCNALTYCSLFGGSQNTTASIVMALGSPATKTQRKYSDAP